MHSLILGTVFDFPHGEAFVTKSSIRLHSGILAKIIELQPF